MARWEGEWDLENAVKREGESLLDLTLAPNYHLIIDGDIRIYIKSVSGNQVRLSIIAPKDVPIDRSNRSFAPKVRDH